MHDLRTVVRDYVAALAGPHEDDVCHSLLELGPAALPHLVEEFRCSRDAYVRVRLAEVVSWLQTVEALPFLTELLHSVDPKLWKTALDGIVMLGDNRTVRMRLLEVLTDAREIADAEKRSWIEEAVGQIADHP
jgi:hypothetical protein